jgi:hypothetical protein
MSRYIDCVELELLNRNHVLLPNDWSKVYNLKEKSRVKLKLVSRFPFISFEKERYVKFRFRTQYKTIDSLYDPSFNVRCSLSQLAFIFGVNFRPFEKSLVEHDLEQL